MLPYIPQDLYSPRLQALVILRNGLPPRIRLYVTVPMIGMMVGDMIAYILEAEMVAHAMQADDVGGDHQAPVDDASIGESFHDVGPAPPEDSIPAVPVQEVPAQEAEDEMDAEDQDAADTIVAPEDPPADPPIIDISSDEEEDEEDMEPEPEHAGWIEDEEDFDDDPEEILFDNGNWEADSDASLVVTIEYID
ncbi:hypothetical protein TIFTF001_013926 [Ficus carica]|uniref:Uncharacterized protein n=1 Tax=Ficus carica TaxID=3494 RepID=A0AA88A1V3_FICCA|nr:hypothetical protein TIFTF001_013926 [Ficus carica]